MPTPAQSRQRGGNVGFRSRIWPFAKREISALKHASTLPTKETQCSTGRIWHSHPRARESNRKRWTQAVGSLSLLSASSALPQRSQRFKILTSAVGASGNPAKQSLRREGKPPSESA